MGSNAPVVKRILVIQLRQLGDLLMITPVLRALQALHPEASLDVLCEPSGSLVLGHNPRVSALRLLPRKEGLAGWLDLVRELRAQRYDLVVDCQGLPSTALLAWLSGARVRLGFARDVLRNLLYTRPYDRRNTDYSALDKLKLLQDSRVDLEDLQLEFPVLEESRQAAEQFARERFHAPVAALFGVSRRSYKVWPPEKLAVLGDRLAEVGYQPFLVYGPGEQEAARAIAARMTHEALVDYPMPDFGTLKEILARCALFAGNDGGPKHLAALSGVPSVTVYCHVHPESWTRPDDPRQRWVATASASRALPTQGPCEAVDTLAEIEVDTVWSRVEALARDGFIPFPARKA